MTEKISNVGATTNTPVQDNPPSKLKAEPRINIREGMRVADVQASGSAAQKLVAGAFQETSWDYEKGELKYHSTYDKDGAEAMNNYTFALDGNELRAYNKKTGCNVTIKASSQEELKEYASCVRSSETLKGGNIVFDSNTKTATYNGVSGNMIVISDRRNKNGEAKIETITFINSDLQGINANLFTGNLNIKNTKQVGSLWDSPTEIRVQADPHKRPTLNVDDASEVKIKLSKRNN